MHEGSPSPAEFEVAIVGCGPVGALAANLVAATGLSTLVIDREPGPATLPRACHLDHEMMRLFQSVGLAVELREGMNETQGHLHVGADHGVIRYMGTAGRPKPYGWANDYFFYQPELEATLRAGIACFPHAELRVDATLEAMEQDGSGVTLQLRAGETVSQVRARYAIGCDGARSTVRKLLNIELDDLDFEEPWLVIDAEVDGPVRFPDLWGVPDGADLQSLSVMLCDPARPATVVPGRGTMRRWEFMLLPGEDDAQMMRPERVAALLAPYLTDIPHRLVRATTYRFHGLVAREWQRGRVFLAGDAAHQTPPFFGQGMCHGMRDAANLAWKLAAVMRGHADAALLATYQPERDPHVRSVIEAAVAAGRYICELDPAKAMARDAVMRARGGVAETAADLIPAIGTGAIAAAPSVAERFIQPAIGAALLDDVTGQGWRLFVRADQIAAARRAVAAAPIPVAAIDADALGDNGAVARWLDDRAVRAVLVRPDFYVFGTAADAGADLLHQLARALAPAPTTHFEEAA